MRRKSEFSSPHARHQSVLQRMAGTPKTFIVPDFLPVNAVSSLDTVQQRLLISPCMVARMGVLTIVERATTLRAVQTRLEQGLVRLPRQQSPKVAP